MRNLYFVKVKLFIFLVAVISTQSVFAQKENEVLYVDNIAQLMDGLGSDRTLFITADTIWLEQTIVIRKVQQLSIQGVNDEPAVFIVKPTCISAFSIYNSSTIDFENLQIQFQNINTDCHSAAVEVRASVDVLVNNCILYATAGTAVKAIDVFGLTVSQTTITESVDAMCFLEHTTNTLINLCSFINNGSVTYSGKIEFQGCNMISFKNCFFSDNFSETSMLTFSEEAEEKDKKCNHLELDRCTFENNTAEILSNLPDGSVIITENFFSGNSFDKK